MAVSPLRALLAATMPLLLIAASAGPAPAGPRAVVELFTSQGCSSCPPADRLIGALAEEREDVIALTMPVTIWDFLGWTDTLARPELTQRQLDYSHARGDMDIYTPQVVVNGREDVIGSDGDAILKRIEADNADGPALPVPVSVERSGDVLSVRVGAQPLGMDPVKATVWLAEVARAVEVPIRGGENRGRRLVYHNVVRSLTPVGMWRGHPLAMELPVEDTGAAAGSGKVVLVQEMAKDGPVGPILGAAALEDVHAALPAPRTTRTAAAGR